MINVEQKTIPENINVHLLPIQKFKTVLVTVFIHQVLDKDLATWTALLPAVLQRGTQEYPTYRDLKTRLEELYGAELTADVIKRGERHVLSFSLEMINEKFAYDESLLEQGLSVLRSVIFAPLLENGRFKKDYVEQEKEQLAKEIQGLINNKINYAVERCFQVMCAEERFGVYKYGRVEDLEKITPEWLYDYYRKIIQENPIDVFVVGEFDPESVYSSLKETMSCSRAPGVKEIPPEEVDILPQEVNYHEEKLPVNQGKLNLGYRTRVSYGDEKYVPLLFYNGILGGFPHSKLFQNVREKASLAYFAFSNLEKHKGVQVLGSGIDVSNYEKALGIIKEQVELMKKGEISSEEMENTRRGLLTQVKTLGDNPYNLVNFFLDGLIGNRSDNIESLVRRIESVTVDEVVNVAQEVNLDTVYFLRSLDGERGEEE